MVLTIAIIKSDNHLDLCELDLNSMQVSSKRIDTISIADESINALFYDGDDDLPSLEQIFEKEEKFYPVAPIQSLGLSKSNFENIDGQILFDSYLKSSTRWILSNNIKMIEQIYPTITYLKDLWVRDRNSFFEELWFSLKTNLATTELNIIFHDLKEPTDKQAEKGEKAKLCFSYVQGKKLPTIFSGKEKEAMLMKEYESEFSDIFTITDYSKEQHQLVACAKMGLSPILIMAKLPNLNQLQKSILVALFTGLQEV